MYVCTSAGVSIPLKARITDTERVSFKFFTHCIRTAGPLIHPTSFSNYCFSWKKTKITVHQTRASVSTNNGCPVRCSRFEMCSCIINVWTWCNYTNIFQLCFSWANMERVWQNWKTKLCFGKWTLQPSNVSIPTPDSWHGKIVVSHFLHTGQPHSHTQQISREFWAPRCFEVDIISGMILIPVKQLYNKVYIPYCRRYATGVTHQLSHRV